METEIENLKKKHGGARKRAGRKPGGMNRKTLEEKIVMEEIRQRVLHAKDSLINSQMNLAHGVSFLYRIDKETDKKGNTRNSKPILVTSQAEIEAYLAGEYEDAEETYYYITTEKPDNKALDSLLDRTFGKAIQRTEMTGKDGGELVVNIVKYGDKSAPSIRGKTIPGSAS